MKRGHGFGLSLCNLCVRCASVVFGEISTTETQRTQRLHREETPIQTLSSPLFVTGAVLHCNHIQLDPVVTL
jgi:hypothetical protein